MSKERPLLQLTGIMLNQPHFYDGTDFRNWLGTLMNEGPEGMFKMTKQSQFPTPRFLPEGKVRPYSDPTSRYVNLPEIRKLAEYDSGIEMEEFIGYLIPEDNSSRMLIEPLNNLLTVAAKHFSTKYKNYYPTTDTSKKPSHLKYFAAITESQAIGLAFDRLYRNIGTGLEILIRNSYDYATTPILDYLIKRKDKGRLDLDISFRSLDNSHDPELIIECWEEIRGEIKKPKMSIRANGEIIYEGKNFKVIERSGRQDDEGILEGWRLIREVTNDGTEIVVLQAGIFSCSDNPLSEDDLVLEKNIFSIELGALPYDRELIKPSNSRAGDCATFPDKFLRLIIKSRSWSEILPTVYEFGWDWVLNRHGRNKWLLFNSDDLFNYKSQSIEILSRGLKQLAAKVGVFDVTQKIGQSFESKINQSLWEYLDLDHWSLYLINNLLSAAHLSPFVFGINMIPNSRLDALPQETGKGSLRRKLAEHGTDYTLSLGQLWPDIFLNLSDEQIVRFLEALPKQETYLDDYLADLDRYEQTGNLDELKLEHQGIYYIMNALKAAGVEFSDFGGNYLMQFLFLFRHPHDLEIENLKTNWENQALQRDSLIIAQAEQAYVST